ncbi:HET domain-containing protein [Fusarium sp. LHS14.1]|nr:HET domain-containing protein [Fusarium sp. LHS14.1]
MVETAPYTFKPIRHNQIRLLKFVQGKSSISAVLEAFSVEQSLPPYHALTYTWASETADPTKSSMLEIDNRMFPVLDSLWPFFETLRSKSMLLDGRWWWIDSICINQADFEERRHQVQLMHLIYRQAEQVIVWLGEPSSDSGLAMNFVRFLDKTTRRKLSVAEVRAMLQEDHDRTR